jgi:hypothetical protein
MGKPYCLDHYKETDNYSYGLDADLKKKMDAKLDTTKLSQAQAWIESLSGLRAGGQTFQEFLKDGIALCKAINAIKSGSVGKINHSKMPFPQMENIAAYLAVCKDWGMKSSDLFMTKDLYENANMVIVIDNIHALGSLSRKQSGFHGPYLGVKLADESRRDFTPAQLNAGQSVPSRQTVGSYGYQDESHNPVLDRQIIKNVSGHTASAAPSKQTQGSYGYQVEKDKNLDKIIKQPVNTPSMAVNNFAPASSSSGGGGGAAGKFCSTCGTARDGAGKFCSNCGGSF